MNGLLTKSLFSRALKCPIKLFYAGKPEYADNSLDDDFLESLAKGGVQVGALARSYFPEGILVDAPDSQTALAKTTELLQRDRVVLFEGAIRHGSCLIRADILVKDGSRIDLIEVKAKSCDFDTSTGFRLKRGGIDKDWLPYLFDVAFQKHVLQQAYPGMAVSAFLMMADKRKKVTVDGLNQKLPYEDVDGRLVVELQGDCSKAALGVEILVKVPVDDVLDVLSRGLRKELGERTLADGINWLAENYRDGAKIEWPVGVQCQKCEFKPSKEQRQTGLRSGYCECWREQWGLTEDQLEEPNVFDIWNFRNKADLLDGKKFFLKDVTEEEIAPEAGDKPGLSTSQRQWLQVKKVKEDDLTPYFDRKAFSAESDRFRYPLHFIDFETAAVAVPFTSGRRPYEEIAFQFSHHVVQADGGIAHAGQWLDATPGLFPNYEFVRRLKAELDKDEGTIFRYADHENTYLNKIMVQLLEEPGGKVPDRDELVAWIRTITKSAGNSKERWNGSRNMVDMRELVVRYYYNPRTRGSNSIKHVLPAALNSSPFLKEKYSSPIYGIGCEVPSLNIVDPHAWIKLEPDGKVKDPYKLLPAVFHDITPEQIAYIESPGEKLANGAAAMMAYARLQFSQMAPAEREKFRKALLRYCELDTMAMVMIWEHFRELAGQ